MNPGWFHFVAARALFVAGGLFVAQSVHGEPFVPLTDEQVLERLPTKSSDPVERRLRRERAQLAKDPAQVSLAISLARRYIERGRAEGDPRDLGHAQAALAHWWNEVQPPTEILVLRATIKQSRHDFPNALVDLDRAIAADPRCAQAWLTRATILTVLGRYDEAREACRTLVPLVPRLISTTLLAQLASLTGQGDRAVQLLEMALERSPSASPSEKLWALTVLAEASDRLGHPEEAQAAFQRALALGQRDVYLLGAYTDFLLDHDRPAAVVALLKDETRVDPLLLRLALVEAAATKPPSSLRSHIDALAARFEACRLRGDSVHAREEARFALHLFHDPLRALSLAQANWQVQREPADARILLEAARAAHDPKAAAPVREFLSTNHCQNVHLNATAWQAAPQVTSGESPAVVWAESKYSPGNEPAPSR